MVEKDIDLKKSERETIIPRWWRPTNFIRELDRLFEDFRMGFEGLLQPWRFPFRPWDFMPRLPEPAVRTPYVDVVDKGDRLVVTVELPGYSKEEVDLTLNKDTLEIRAEHREVKEEHEKSYLHRERSYRAFHRRITLPEEVLADKAKAKMDKGILEIELPKKEPKPKEEGVRIEVK